MKPTCWKFSSPLSGKGLLPTEAVVIPRFPKL
jgi:hypothetical protein